MASSDELAALGGSCSASAATPPPASGAPSTSRESAAQTEPRMKPWIAKRLFGQDRLLAASFPAPILTDAHTIVYYLRKKLSRDALQRKLGDERLQKAVAAMRKHAPEFPCLDRLATRIEEWRVEAQTVGFVADKYYDAERATSYTARLLNFDKGSKRRKVDEGDNCRTTEMDANSGASSGAFASGGSGGSQAALARLCVACCEWSGGRAAEMRSQPEPTGANKGGYLVADFGCGTGLSSGFFPDRSFVLGLDASRAMLEQFPQKLGDAIHTDLSQGIPLRPGVLDGAISVACVHYLCTPGPDGRAAEARVRPLIRYRIPNNNFCYQVFRHGDLDSAEKVADFFVDVAEREMNPSCTVVKDFPHRKRAERVFIAGQGKLLGEVVVKRKPPVPVVGQEVGGARAEGTDESERRTSSTLTFAMSALALRHRLLVYKMALGNERSPALEPNNFEEWLRWLEPHVEWVRDHFAWTVRRYVKDCSQAVRQAKAVLAGRGEDGLSIRTQQARRLEPTSTHESTEMRRLVAALGLAEHDRSYETLLREHWKQIVRHFHFPGLVQ